MSYKEILIDGSKVVSHTYRGFGAIIDNNLSKLLVDYKLKNPDSYNEIVDLLFKNSYGASLSHIKIKLNMDSCFSYDNEVNVKGIPVFILAADARKVNSGITVDLMLCESTTLPKGDSSYKIMAKCYTSFIDIIDAIYDIYGIKINYISIGIKSIKDIGYDWIIYLSERLKREPVLRYDYSAIKMVLYSDKEMSEASEKMLNSIQLRNSIDILDINMICINEDIKTLNEKFDKEIWYHECSGKDTGYDSCEYETDCLSSSINEIAKSCRIGNASMYEFKNAIVANYDCKAYQRKCFINAEKPWSGYYTIESCLFSTAHLSHFIKSDWKYVNTACDKVAAFISEEGDYTLIFTNKSNEHEKYRIYVKNTEKSDNYVYCVETRGPEHGEAYNSKWFDVINKIIPAKDEDRNFYDITIKAHSILTCTTLDVTHVNGINAVSECKKSDTFLELPYYEKLAYSEETFKKHRNLPLYMLSVNDAFEAVKENEKYILQQKLISCKSNEIYSSLIFGDDSWSDYCVCADIKFSEYSDDNYAGIGLRCNTITASENSLIYGFKLMLSSLGKWQFIYMNDIINEGNSDILEWNKVQLYAKGNKILSKVNNIDVYEYEVDIPMHVSGRVALFSSMHKNCFCNIDAMPLSGKSSYVKRVCCLADSFVYTGSWIKNEARGVVLHDNVNKSSETSFSFSFFGTGFAFTGEAYDLKIKLEVDGKIEAAGMSIDHCGFDQAFYYQYDLENTEHIVNVTIQSGSLTLHSAEVISESNDLKTVAKYKDDQKSNGKLISDSGKSKKVKKSTLFIGAGLAAAGAGLVIASKIMRKFSKKLDK